MSAAGDPSKTVPGGRDVADNSSSSIEGWNRKGALEEIDSLKLLRATSLEQHSHSFKWLTASLLALNGGGLLAIAQSEKIGTQNVVVAGASFAVGLAFALLVAVLGQRAIIASLVPLQKQIGYWMTVCEDGIRSENLEADLALELKKSVRLSRFGQVLGWLSALALFGGVYLAGAGMVASEREKASIDASRASVRKS